MKLISRCETCKKVRWIVKKRSIKLPTGGAATSQKLMCRRCLEAVEKAMRVKTRTKN